MSECLYMLVNSDPLGSQISEGESNHAKNKYKVYFNIVINWYLFNWIMFFQTSRNRFSRQYNNQEQ